jgi:hypothetical protein
MVEMLAWGDAGMYLCIPGGLLGLFGGVLVKAILSPNSGLAFPDNYALLFFLGFLITVAMVSSFSLIVEPVEPVDPQRVGLGEQLRRVIRLPIRDRNYSRYLAVRAAIVGANYALPFYAVYARRALDAPEDMVGIYLIGSALAGVFSNLLYDIALAAKIIAIEEQGGPFQAMLQRTMRMVPDRQRKDKNLQRLIAFRLRQDGETETHAYLIKKIRDIIQCGYTGSWYDYLKDDTKEKAYKPGDRNDSPPDVA